MKNILGGFRPGGFCPGGFCPGGFCPRGILSRGFCLGGFVQGDFVLIPTNVYTLFNKHQRRKTSHGKRHYNKKAPQPESNTDALITLIDMIDQPEGVHKIKTHLFSMSLPQLSSLQEIA